MWSVVHIHAAATLYLTSSYLTFLEYHILSACSHPRPDKTGDVTLDDLMRAGENPEFSAELAKLSLPKFELKPQDVKRSLLTLYHFDRNKDCKMGFDEFVGLLRYLRLLEDQERQLRKEEEESARMTGKIFRRVKSGGSDPEPQLASPSRNSVETVVRRYRCSIDGRDIDMQNVRLRVPMFTSSTSGLNITQEEENAILKSDAETRSTLLAQLKTPKGRLRFMQWLFRLADTDKTNCVTPKELYMFLKAVAADGINPECVCMDPVIANSPVQEPASPSAARKSFDSPIDGIPVRSVEDLKFHKVVRRVMNSFDVANDGVLSRSEFMVLADLIEREYELSDSYTGGEYIGDLHLLRTLGVGSEGHVKLAVEETTGRAVAVKVIKRGNTASMSRVDREIQAMMMLHHPNVVQVKEVLETDHHIYLVMDLCTGGELSSHVNSHKPLSEPVARYYFAQLVSGVAYCHSMGVCHRDLRVENLMLDMHGQLKITDFGHAGTFQPGWDLFQTMFVGSLSHLAPEQIHGTCYSGEKLDVWSMGVILYHLLVGHGPFEGSTVEALFDNISNAKFRRTGRYSRLNPLAAKAIDDMLQLDPQKRPLSSELLQHEWLVSGKCEQLVMVHLEAIAKPTALFSVKALADALIANMKHHLIETRIMQETGDSMTDSTIIQCASRFVDRERNIAFTLELSPSEPKKPTANRNEAADEESSDDGEGETSSSEGTPSTVSVDLEGGGTPVAAEGGHSHRQDGQFKALTVLGCWRVSANLLSGDSWFFNRIFMRLVHTKYTCASLSLKEYTLENAAQLRRVAIGGAR